MSVKKVFFVLMFLLFLWGCAGLEVAVENQNLGVISTLDKVPFFDSRAGDKVFISIRNFSEYKDLDVLTTTVAQRYEKRGFIIVNNPEKARWIVEAKIVNIKREDFTAREVKGVNTEEETVKGAILGGAAAGSTTGSWRSAVAGGLIGGVLSGVANLTVNSWVKLGYLTIVTDVQVMEKVADTEKKVKWKKYRFQALTRAKKVNLKWEDCKDAMIKEITRIIASLL